MSGPGCNLTSRNVTVICALAICNILVIYVWFSSSLAAIYQDPYILGTTIPNQNDIDAIINGSTRSKGLANHSADSSFATTQSPTSHLTSDPDPTLQPGESHDSFVNHSVTEASWLREYNASQLQHHLDHTFSKYTSRQV